MGSGRGWPTTRSTPSIWCRGHPGRTCGSRANKPWTSRVGNVLPFARSSSVLTPTLLACYAMSGVIHLASISLNTLLPFHVVALGGSRTQVGLLFSATTVVSMALRPAVGGWIDRFGARWVILPGIAVLAVASLALHVPVTPEAVIAVMVGTGIGNGLVSMTASVLTVRASGVAHRGEALSLYYLASSLAIAVAPPMAFGLRRLCGMPLAFAPVPVFAVVLFALALTGLAYFTLALPPTPASLMIAALLLGAGSAVLYPTLAALVVDRAPEGERGLALGTLSGAWDLGVVVGSALIGFVADRVSFGSGFAIAGVTTMLGALAFFVTERHQTRRASVV